jgi:DNA-binding HxlR family transcriptional regulator
MEARDPLPSVRWARAPVSELRRSIPAVSEKMLIQQLRHMERDGVVRRFVHHQVPPKVEYSLTDWGQALCPALNALLRWVELRPFDRGGARETHSRNTDARYRSGVFGASDGLTYRVSVGPTPVICTSTGSAPVRAK